MHIYQFIKSLKHAGYPFAKDIDIRWIDSSEVTDENAAGCLPMSTVF